MAVKRDYGSFVRASRTLLGPLVRPLGYEDIGGGFFARRGAGWLESAGLPCARVARHPE